MTRCRLDDVAWGHLCQDVGPPLAHLHPTSSRHGFAPRDLPPDLYSKAILWLFYVFLFSPIGGLDPPQFREIFPPHFPGLIFPGLWAQHDFLYLKVSRLSIFIKCLLLL